MYNSGLIPVKFLILIAHLLICITLLWSIQENTKLCLMEDYKMETQLFLKSQLTVGLSLALGMIIFELLVFLTGVTMFNINSALLSIFSHASACALLCWLVFDRWHCGWYWWIFSACSILPVLYDTYVTFDVFLNRKY